MVTPLPDLGRRVEALRRDFDRIFSQPSTLVTVETEDLLAIGVAGDAYALKVGELAGLVSGRKVVALPNRTAHLLGVAGVRGAVVPVYALSGLLGYGDSGGSTPWLAQCGRQEPVALAFEQLEGFFRVPRADLHAAGGEARHHVAESVRVGNVTRRVIDTRSILAAIQAGAGASGTTKER